MSTDAKKLKGTRTEANLMAAFAGESQAQSSTPTMLPAQRKTAMCRFQIFRGTAHNERARKDLVRCCTSIQPTDINLQDAQTRAL